MASLRSIQVFLRRTVASSLGVGLLAVALFITLKEVERLISQVLGEGGHTHDLGAMIGPSAGAEFEAWRDWSSAAFDPSPLVITHTLVDLLFIGCYVLLLRRLIRAATAAANARREDDAPPVSATPGLRMVGLLAGLDLVEDAMLLVLAAALPAAGTPTLDAATLVLIVATYLKLATAAVLGLWLLLGSGVGERVRAALSLAFGALYAQRLSLLAVLAVGGLSLVSGDGVLEQMADVYRGWLQYPASAVSALPQFDLWPVLFAGLAFAITGAALFVLGRQRARHYRRPAGP